MKSTIVPYKYPREIEFIKELPKTSSGKILRRELRRWEKEKIEKKKDLQKEPLKDLQGEGTRFP